MDITISLITTLVLTLINGYFSMSEMALTTAKRAVLEHEAEEGDKRAERAIKLAADSDQLLATIQVAITWASPRPPSPRRACPTRSPRGS